MKKILEDLSQLIGTEGTRKHLTASFLKLCSDEEFRVRKGAIVHLSGFLKCLTQDTVSADVLPVFFELCKDQIWGVRKACAENMPLLANSCAPSDRSKFIALYESLVKDVSCFMPCTLCAMR
jgi:serine/threonine-protein phosphatase 4 regulatory subunit 1